MNERIIEDMRDVKVYPPGVVPEPFVYPWLIRQAAQIVEPREDDE